MDLAQPVSRAEPAKARETDGTETDIPTYNQHLLCDEQGSYPAELDMWEEKVLQVVMKREVFRFWYRNPDRPSQDSLANAYESGNDTRLFGQISCFLGNAEALYKSAVAGIYT